jgi:hypothetical protein
MSQEQLNYIVSQIDNTYSLKLLIVLSESAGDIFLATSLLQSLKEDLYPDYEIYFACNKQFHDILKNNPYIYKTIIYQPIMNNALAMEGQSNWRGLFDISLELNILTQIHVSYHHNGRDKSIYFDNI